MLKRIIECEDRVLQDRKLLNELLNEYPAGDVPEITGAKIDELQRELNFMNRQLEVLRREYYRRMQTAQPQHAPNLATQSQQENNPAAQPQHESGPAMAYQQAGQQTPQGSPTVTYPNWQKQKKDMEKTIGKSLMGIFASVLIFVSLILFATLVLPHMTDLMKQVLMFGVSLAFAVVGNILLRKDCKNKWFLSLTGCGMGAVYLSLLVSRLYFNAITDITLYICILVWAVVICILSRLRSQIFLVIGQAGVLISVLFGVILCCTLGDGNRVLFLVIYFLLAEAVFCISHMQKEYGENLLNHIFVLVCMVIFLFATNQSHDFGTLQGVIAAVILAVMACALILAGIFFFKVSKKSAVAFGVLNIFYFMVTAFSVAAHFSEYDVAATIMLVLTAGLLAGLEWRFRETEEDRVGACVGKRIFQAALFFALLLEVTAIDVVMEYSSLALPAIFCLLYGFLKNQKVYKVAGIVYSAWFVPAELNAYLYLSWGIAVFTLLIMLNCRYKEQYRTWIKLVGYPVFLAFIITCEHRLMWELSIPAGEMRDLLLLTVLAAINICMMKLPVLCTHLHTGEEEKGFLLETGLIHILQMLVALNYISVMEPMGYHLFAIMLGFALFVANISNILKRFQYKWSSVYVGTKIFVFFLVILDSFEAPDYLFSIVALLFAIAFIAIGFFAEKRTGKNVKSIRIYGLGLSLLSIFKLLLLDIHYDNMLSLAVSFFVSGFLCFAISFIYNRVDKKIAQKAEQ